MFQNSARTAARSPPVVSAPPKRLEETGTIAVNLQSCILAPAGSRTRRPEKPLGNGEHGASQRVCAIACLETADAGSARPAGPLGVLCGNPVGKSCFHGTETCDVQRSGQHMRKRVGFRLPSSSIFGMVIPFS